MRVILEIPLEILALLYFRAPILISLCGCICVDDGDGRRMVKTFGSYKNGELHMPFFVGLWIIHRWDHALAAGEVIFLSYGVWICWRIRENPDAQFISYSIYNIAIINILMVALQ